MTIALNPISRRLAELIECKTGGNRVMFATSLGWSKQRLTNVLAGKSVGLTVIEDTLRAYKDVNARWLIFGEGNMLTLSDIRLGSRYNTIKRYEQYLPVMTDAEVALLASGKSDFSPQDLDRWTTLARLRQQAIEQRFNTAIQAQNKLKLANNPQ